MRISELQLLDRIERIGNRLPHPTLLFVWLCGVMLLLSALSAALDLRAEHPISGETLAARSLLSRDGLHWILTHTVSNFVAFAPVGTVLVAIMGIGVAEHTGLLRALLRQLVLRAPRRLLTFIVVTAGVLSSIAADAGYVVLIPLAGMVFAAAGRNPLTGIAAAFAGVSGGYSANLVIGPVDAILAGISTEAARLVAAGYEVNAAGNYYFIVASTALIGVVGTWITEAVVAPRLGGSEATEESIEPLSRNERRGLAAAGWFSLAFVLLLLAGLVPPQGLLRNPDTAGVVDSPFIGGIVTVIALYAAIAGWLYGRASGNRGRAVDVIKGMENSMGTMASYLVLMFFAAQFVNYFAWSRLGSIIAIHGAEWLQAAALGSATLMLSFVLAAALINLFVGSASAKWALLAPVFVPMLYLVGISPEASQMAFRIGDSSTNIITPLMPYFGVVVAFAQRYDKDIGIGTIIAMMLPYTLAFLAAWSLLLLGWTFADWPLGPGAPIGISP